MRIPVALIIISLTSLVVLWNHGIILNLFGSKEQYILPLPKLQQKSWVKKEQRIIHDKTQSASSTNQPICDAQSIGLSNTKRRWGPGNIKLCQRYVPHFMKKEKKPTLENYTLSIRQKQPGYKAKEILLGRIHTEDNFLFVDAQPAGYKHGQVIKPHVHPENNVILNAWIEILDMEYAFHRNAEDMFLWQYGMVIEILRSSGFQVIVSLEEPQSWDVKLRSIFGGERKMTGLKNLEHMATNCLMDKFPILECITKKDRLLAAPISFIKPSYILPEERVKFLKNLHGNTDKYWILKKTTHRGVELRSVDYIKHKIFKDRKGDKRIVTGFVSNPQLIEGKKFDLGAHMAITSVDPPRFYMYHRDWLVKLCNEDFYPLDPKNKSQYVEAENPLRLRSVPAFQKAFEDEPMMTEKEFLIRYLDKKGKNGSQLAWNVLEAMAEVAMVQEPSIYREVENFKWPLSPDHMFQLLRVDLVPDEKLKPWIMEANYHPFVMYSTKVPGSMITMFDLHKNLYNLVGILSMAQTKGKQLKDLIPDKDITLINEECACELCGSTKNCANWKCKPCFQCLSLPMKKTLRKAVQEYRRKTGWARVMPPPYENSAAAAAWLPDKDPHFFNISDNSKAQFLWFRAKCIKDSTWCA